ncbi:hypothetical protein [Alicyclobacillus fructus]|uniref:hypothetical protein n=1 Tax=Alicyclobacillus fructus TaxID=2816082 RepID=UPI001A8DAD8E|nr:hypothetical protein [Alicyclobacillus fructus]
MQRPVRVLWRSPEGEACAPHLARLARLWWQTQMALSGATREPGEVHRVPEDGA